MSRKRSMRLPLESNNSSQTLKKSMIDLLPKRRLKKLLKPKLRPMLKNKLLSKPLVTLHKQRCSRLLTKLLPRSM